MNRLKELRFKKNLSMADVARALNMPYTTYVNYEKGSREPNSETLILFANYYGCSIDYLIGKSDILNSYDEYESIPLYELIKNKRTELNLTVNEIAKLINKDTNYVLSLENNEMIEMSITTMFLLSDILKIPPIVFALKCRLFNEKDNANRLALPFSQQKIILSQHETDVIIAYRQQPTMQEAVDRLLGVELATSTKEEKLA